MSEPDWAKRFRAEWTLREQVTPDGWTFLPNPVPMDVVRRNAELSAKVVKLREEGLTWFRYTAVEDGVWIESWKVSPIVQGKREADFAPPMTYATPDAAA